MSKHATAGPSPPYCTPENEACRETVRRFVARENEPFATQWDEAGEFPPDLYVKAGAVGGRHLGLSAASAAAKVERIYRKAKVNARGGDAEEIVKDRG